MMASTAIGGDRRRAGMAIRCRLPSRLALLTLACAACGGTRDEPVGLAPDARDPAVAPPGAGTTTIDMAGTWQIAAFTVEAWDPWRPQPQIADLLGQQIEISARPGSGFSLESF